MLQVFHLNVCICLQWLYMYYSASVLDVCCKCLTVSHICCKCFIWMLKSRSGVAHVAMRPTCHSHMLQLLGRHRGSLCGCLRPTDASAPRHPQAGEGARGFLRAGALVRRKRGSTMVGRHAAWGQRGGAHENRWRRFLSHAARPPKRRTGGVRYFEQLQTSTR
jgi:hypothetical protein